MAKLKLSSPWEIFYKELHAMFKEDPCVHVVFDEENYEIKLYVNGAAKAEALSQLLVAHKAFGNVTVNVAVIPSNDIPFTNARPAYKLYQMAFEGNRALSYVRTVSGIFANDLCYVVFRNKVVQYFNDDLGDANGLCSTLYQEIAKDVFGNQDGVFFCTDVPEGASAGVPLGEWP